MKYKSNQVADPYGRADYQADHAEKDKRSPILTFAPDPLEKLDHGVLYLKIQFFHFCFRYFEFLGFLYVNIIILYSVVVNLFFCQNVIDFGGVSRSALLDATGSAKVLLKDEIKLFR